MTDAISPEFRLEPDSSGSARLSEWQIDDEQDFAFHQPTRTVFAIYPAADCADLATISIHQMRARLSHVCDGFPVPGDLAALGRAAIIAFAYLSTQLTPVELRAYHPGFAADRFRAILEPA